MSRWFRYMRSYEVVLVSKLAFTLVGRINLNTYCTSISYSISLPCLFLSPLKFLLLGREYYIGFEKINVGSIQLRLQVEWEWDSVSYMKSSTPSKLQLSTAMTSLRADICI